MSVPSPRSFEIPYIFQNLRPGNVLNIGGEEGGPWKWRVCENQKMTIVDITPVRRTHPNLTSVCADIRDVTVEQIGLFDNIILMSTLEHISTPFHAPDKKPTWKVSPVDEQLEVFHQCMKFLKPGGHMIFTVPLGIPIDHTKTSACFSKVHYNKKMLEDIKKDYKVLHEIYKLRPESPWVTYEQLDESVFRPEEEDNMQINNAGTRGIVMMVLSK